MKYFLITILILFNFTINAQNGQSDKNIINTIIGKIDSRDLKCSSEIDSAKINFKSKETFYNIVPEGYIKVNAYRHHPFLIELLKKKGIIFSISEDPEMDIYYENNGERYQLITNCYCKASNELIKLKHGNQFIKNIEREADSLYVTSKLNDVFDYPNDIDDYFIIYPKAKGFFDQKIQIQKDFFENFKFPNDFLHSLDKRDFLAKTNFIIKKDSKVSKIKITIKFKQKENQKFKNNITNQLKQFIQNANWKAAVSSGVNVDCKFDINFYN